jgi:hypothetical protein
MTVDVGVVSIWTFGMMVLQCVQKTLIRLAFPMNLSIVNFNKAVFKSFVTINQRAPEGALFLLLGG